MSVYFVLVTFKKKFEYRQLLKARTDSNLEFPIVACHESYLGRGSGRLKDFPKQYR